MRKNIGDFFSRLSFQVEFAKTTLSSWNKMPSSLRHPMNESAHENIEVGLSTYDVPLRLWNDVTNVAPEIAREYFDGIEYQWEIDLDNARFGVGTCDTGMVCKYWSWKKLCCIGEGEFFANAK
jgi:hypothetical protein